MNIGVYIGDMNPKTGGGYTFQTELLQYLFLEKKIKHSFFFFSNSFHSGENYLGVIGLKQRYSMTKKNYFFFRWFRKISKLIFKFRKRKVPSLLQKAVDEYLIDIVWCISPAYQKVNVPYFYTVWDLQHRLQPFFPEVNTTGWKWNEREIHYKYILPRATKVITGTEVGKKEIINFYNIYEKNISVIPFPAPLFSDNDIEPINVTKKFGVGNKYMMYPAQFWPHKNHVNLLLSIALLKKEYGIELECVFTGDDKGNLDYIKNLTQTLKLQNQIYFLGFVSRNELANLYMNSIAMCFPSFFGPDNIPPLEAFSLGCPVLAANVDGAKEQMGDAALYFEPDDVNDISKVLKSIVEDGGELRRKLILNGYAQVKKKTSINYLNSIYKIIDDFEAINRCWDK